MRKFSKIGAIALAAALSITLVAPITANAEVTWTKDAAGKKTYTNEDTKKSLSENEFTGDLDGVLESDIKVVTIAVDSYNETVQLATTLDVAKFENFKSNKKGMKVKVLDKYEYTDSGEKYPASPDYYSKDLKTWYYKNVNGEIVSGTDVNALPKGEDNGRYTIRLYAKKAGTYKLKFDAKMKNGSTVKKTIKVIAKKDGQAIKSVTFAGKDLTYGYYELESDGLKNNRTWAKGFGPNYTTAKSGKIRVTMNADFKLKKIEIGTKRTKVVDGVEQWDPSSNNSLDRTYNWKKVKNGKKITLNKNDQAMVGIKPSEGQTISYKNTSATTYVRVTYYDKKNKTTHRVIFEIERVLK